MSVSLGESYEYCRTLARRTGRNFYYSFLTLPRRLAADMCVLYAFLRLTDDLGDDTDVSISDRAVRLGQWRRDMVGALEGQPTTNPVFPALVDIVKRHQVPVRNLHDVIDGVASDLLPRVIRTFQDLEQYTYQVAGAVGLCCIQIWGYDDPRACKLAVDCGTAFQLTNILRDLGEDAQMGRVYLPQEDLERFDYSLDDLQAGRRDERFVELMRFETQRAREYYGRAEGIMAYLSRPGRRIQAAMMEIYRGLLDEIERRNFDVYSKRVSLSKFRKLRIALASCFQR
jgi:phytoene synthase